MRNNRVYLAGPEVFLADADEIFRAKKAICGALGLEGVSPFDNEVPRRGRSRRARARAIYAGNAAAMRSCAAAIANLTPFRGVSMDAGTAFEVGFMVALDRVVFGYSNAPTVYRERVIRLLEDSPLLTGHGDDDWSIEDFDLHENLMIPLGIEASGGAVVAGAHADGPALFRDLTAFRACAERIAEIWSGNPEARDRPAAKAAGAR